MKIDTIYNGYLNKAILYSDLLTWVVMRYSTTIDFLSIFSSPSICTSKPNLT